MSYRGYQIRRTRYQGLTAYLVPELYGRDLAANLRTAKRWIDWAIYSGELRRVS